MLGDRLEKAGKTVILIAIIVAFIAGGLVYYFMKVN